MKKLFGMSLIAVSVVMAQGHKSITEEIAHLQKEIKKLKVKLGKVNAQSANDNLKWGVDFRTALDSIEYDLADGRSVSKNDLMSTRLWLNMAYSPNSHNVFKGQLSMNKAFGADFYNPMKDGYTRAMSMGGSFDWTANEALTDNSLKVKQAYWLYLGEKAFGLDMPWTFSIGRRPSTNGFLVSLRDDDPAQSPLGHIINVEFDGLSSKVDLSNITGIDGMTFKICMGQGSTNAQPLFESSASYVNDAKQLEDIKLAGFIFEPYNDGQIITKLTWFRAFDLPGMEAVGVDPDGSPAFKFRQYGDLEGGAFSILVDGLTEDGYFSDVKLFGSFAYSKTRPDSGKKMLGSADQKTGTSYWIGTQLPIAEDGKFGLEYNHGSRYWRPINYAEDTMIGSKLAVRGDALEAYFTYQLTEALSTQIRYTKIDYDYTGSNGFFGNTSGAAKKLDDIKTDSTAELSSVVESAQDLRFYIRYRF